MVKITGTGGVGLTEATLAACVAGVPKVIMTSTRSATNSAAKPGSRVGASRPARFDQDVLPLDIARLAQALQERCVEERRRR